MHRAAERGVRSPGPQRMRQAHCGPPVARLPLDRGDSEQDQRHRTAQGQSPRQPGEHAGEQRQDDEREGA